MKHFFRQKKILSLDRVFCASQSSHPAWMIFAFLVLFIHYLPCPAMASEAPLDTLTTASMPQTEEDPRYAGADIAISRKRLPEVQATTVPKTSTPKKPPRLDNPRDALWHQYLARKAKQQGNSQAMLENLEAASKADPENPRYLWPLVFSALGRLDIPTILEKFPQALTLQIQNPVYRGPLVIAALQGTMVFLGLFWTALVIALTLSWWPYLAHDLSALLVKGKNHRGAIWLPLLLPIVFMILRPGWFGFLALMSVPLLIQTRGATRRLLAATWITAIVLALPVWPLLKQAIPAADPGSEVNLLVQGTSQDASSGLRDQLTQRIQEAREPKRKNRLSVALAIQEARRGRYTASNTIFEKVLATEPDNFPAMVGRANNMYYLGRLDTSADLFHQAHLAHPKRGVILHNQAQVFFKKLFIPEAADALDKSRDLGYAPPVWKNQSRSDKTYSPVVYPGLPNHALQEACSWESQYYAPGIILMAWNTALGHPAVPLFLLLVVPLILAGALVLLWSHQHDPRACENCGVAICGDCCLVRQESWLCNECGGIVDRARSDMILATLLKNRSRSMGMAAASTLVYMGRGFPGAGHLAIGKVTAGWWRLTLVSCGAFLIMAGWAFSTLGNLRSPGILLTQEMIHPVWAPVPFALWEGWLTPVVLIGCGLMAVAWLLALIDGNQLRHQLPERFSLTLSSTRTNQETKESQSVSVS